MEKRNIIEEGRTPDLEKQAKEDTAEKAAVDLFKKTGEPTRTDTRIPCPDKVEVTNV